LLIPKRPDRNAEADFHGHRRKNESTSAPEAKLYKKSTGAEAKLAFMGSS
jgi:hypothetical protein